MTGSRVDSAAGPGGRAGQVTVHHPPRLHEPGGLDTAVEVLSEIDAYYVDRSGEADSVLTSLVISLADPNPRDTEVIDELPRYKGLDARYHRWEDVVGVCRSLALRLSGAV